MDEVREYRFRMMKAQADPGASVFGIALRDMSEEEVRIAADWLASELGRAREERNTHG